MKLLLDGCTSHAVLLLTTVVVTAGCFPSSSRQSAENQETQTGEPPPSENTLAAPTPSPEIEAPQIRIGAWNIEWLGFPDRRGRPGKDNPQTPEDLADYIQSSGVDVLALSEIDIDSETHPLRSQHLDQVVRALQDRHQQPWEYVLFDKTNYPDEADEYMRRGQHVGMAWRTDRATIVGTPWEIPVGSHPEFGIKFFERRANAVKLSFGQEKTDVVFIPVHLKSNRRDADNQDPSYTMRQREEELKAFAKFLPELRDQFKDEDIVLLGDTNILDGQDTGKVLTERGFVDLNGDEQGTTAVWGDGSTGYRTAPFDRIFVPVNQTEFANSKLTVHRTETGSDDEIKVFRRKLSDHYLISSVIEIGSDDD
jgi:endonuclease/exonuclease/phosphatase family metal-dependent hydrolase